MGKMKNYSKMFEGPAEPIDERELHPVELPELEPKTPEPDPVVDETVTEPVTKVGTVVDCNSLNVREYPDRKAPVLTILMADTEVAVNVDEQLYEWYHVYTATGLDGFCMKQYIAVEE